MKKAVIYYFSGSGNTEKVCELYRKEFSEHGVESVLFPITLPTKSFPDPNEYDYVGFAYPIHAFNAPYPVLDFAKKLPFATEKVFFVLKTSGEPLAINRVSSIKLCDILKKKGYRLYNEKHYVMPYNMIFRHTDGMAYRMMETVKKLVPTDAEEIWDEKEDLPKKIPFGRAIAFLFGIEHAAMKINGKFFKVDANKCTLCKKCEKNCPVGNIHIASDGKFTFDNRCAMCTKCSFGCPKDAIRIAILNGWKVNGAYSFRPPTQEEKPSHPNYCKRAYRKYFLRAEEKEKSKR